MPREHDRVVGETRPFLTSRGMLARWGVGRTLALIGITGFLLRALFTADHSAYLDEATFILTGRMLIEHHTEYAGAFGWTYGSYLWAVIAGLADMVGGLELIRLLTSALGAVAAVATG